MPDPASSSTEACQGVETPGEGLRTGGCVSSRLEKAVLVSKEALRRLPSYTFLSNRRSVPWLVLWISILLAAIFGILYSAVQSNTKLARSKYRDKQDRGFDTLVIYAFSNSDSESLRNLHFFIKHGMWEGDGCHYVIIVQDGSIEGTEALPKLPSNARMVRHEGDCFFWGAINWVRQGGLLDIDVFKYIIFLSSVMRGPFLPPYWPASIHWSRILTSRLVGRVKLVGSTISCAPVFQHGDTWQGRRMLPHVQTNIFATDRVGLKLMLGNPQIFECHNGSHDAAWDSELITSAAIFSGNYTIDSLMLRYQGTDWRDPRNVQCNGLKDPDGDLAYDGVALNPFEVVFVKLQSAMIDAQWPTQQMAAAYSGWLRRQGRAGSIASNEHLHYKERFRLGRIFTMQLRGSECFDYEFYKAHSPELLESSDKDLWLQFLEHGQFEDRQFRFMCPDRLGRIGSAEAAIKQVLASPFQLQDLPAEEAAELRHDINEVAAMEQEDAKALHRHLIRRFGKTKERREKRKQAQGGT